MTTTGTIELPDGRYLTIPADAYPSDIAKLLNTTLLPDEDLDDGWVDQLKLNVYDLTKERGVDLISIRHSRPSWEYRINNPGDVEFKLPDDSEWTQLDLDHPGENKRKLYGDQ